MTRHRLVRCLHHCPVLSVVCRSSFGSTVAREYLKHFSFAGMSLDQALRCVVCVCIHVCVHVHVYLRTYACVYVHMLV